MELSDGWSGGIRAQGSGTKSSGATDQLRQVKQLMAVAKEKKTV